MRNTRHIKCNGCQKNSGHTEENTAYLVIKTDLKCKNKGCNKVVVARPFESRFMW